MTLRPTDFRTHDGFRRRAPGRVRSLECATAMAARLELPSGPRRPLSTPASSVHTLPDWLGVTSKIQGIRRL